MTAEQKSTFFIRYSYIKDVDRFATTKTYWSIEELSLKDLSKQTIEGFIRKKHFIKPNIKVEVLALNRL